MTPAAQFSTGRALVKRSDTMLYIRNKIQTAAIVVFTLPRKMHLSENTTHENVLV